MNDPKDEQIKELVSLVLWVTRRTPRKDHKKFSYEELLKIIGDDHEYSVFVNMCMEEEV